MGWLIGSGTPPLLRPLQAKLDRATDLELHPVGTSEEQRELVLAELLDLTDLLSPSDAHATRDLLQCFSRVRREREVVDRAATADLATVSFVRRLDVLGTRSLSIPA